MEWIRSLMLPPQGSAFAGEVDKVYMVSVLAERGPVSGDRVRGDLFLPGAIVISRAG